MLKPHLYRVGERDFATMPMPATEALRVLPEIIRLLGHELTMLWLMADEKGGEGKGGIEALLSNREVMSKAISTICTNAGPDGLTVIRDLMRHTNMAEGERVVKVYDVFDELFAGDIGGMMSVAAHALRASFTRPSVG